MKSYIGVTDLQWFQYLSSLEKVDEVNFWQPGGGSGFKVLAPGELFLFKLHSPNNFIVGGGFFAHATRLPVSLAWKAFEHKNGVTSFEEMKARIGKYRKASLQSREDYTIGCILLEQPFFLPREQWIPQPSDWKPNIVQGKGYNLTIEPGLSLFKEIQAVLQGNFPSSRTVELPRFGDPVMVTPRLGQGSFRVIVTDAYERRCAVTRERTLPVLEAAHIVPYSEGGEHQVNNGLLLRSDIHTLFDRGYVTVNPDHHFEVSGKLKEDFENGRDYYALHGQEILLPQKPEYWPASAHLSKHNEQVYLG
jgi:HNH endonuclease